MRLKKLILENFRCFKERTEIEFDDLNVFVGQNDIGKSTIFEALDIFFKNGVVKIDKQDLSNTATGRGDYIMIGAVFDDLPEKIIIDSDVSISPKDEYLCNDESGNCIEIHKEYTNYRTPKISIKAYHPVNEDLSKLLLLKIQDLKKIAKKYGIEQTIKDERVCSSIRKAIREHYPEELQFEIIDIDANKDEAKNIYAKLEEYFPLYQLFQSDRKNEEKDSEVQDPMKFAIKQILDDRGNEELQKSLTFVKETVENIATEVADLTIKKLAEMNTEIASRLEPRFSDPTWDKAFSFTINSDEDIPLNKRGSGVRRLILLNFFRAEAERKQKDRKVAHVIYAFEEPETSQHPSHQKLLMEAFTSLAARDHSQILLTTHSPSIAKLLPPESLKFLRKQDGRIEIVDSRHCETMLDDIAESLGVLPSITLEDVSKVKAAVCVEGKNDVSFLQNLNTSIEEFKQIVDINSLDVPVILIPLGGKTLQSWVDNNYLKKLKLTEIHIYDRDLIDSNQRCANDVNGRGGNNYATFTEKHMLDNYIHPKLIEERFNIQTPYNESNWLDEWNKKDVPRFIKAETEKEDYTGNLCSASRAKKVLSEELTGQMTKEHLQELQAFDEIKGWFEKIRDALV